MPLMWTPRLARGAALGIAGGLIVAASACSPPAPATPAPQATAVKQIAVNAVPVKRVDIASTLNYTGDVKSQATLSVVPKVAGRIEKLFVDLGSSVKQGDVIAELDKEQANLQVRQAEAAVAAAQQRLATVQSGPRPEAVAQAEANARAAHARVAALQQAARPEQIAQAQANLEAAQQRVESVKTARPEAVAAAEDNIKAAEARLEALKKGPTPEQIRSAEIGVEQAKNALYAVQTQKDAACNRAGAATQTGCMAAQKQAAGAEEGVKGAQQQLAIAKAGPTTEQLAQAQAGLAQVRAAADLARQPASTQDVAQAENAVKAAQAVLSLMRSPVLASDVAGAQAQADAADAAARLAANPYTRQDLDAAQASVDQAQASVELARSQLKELTVVSPVAGVVADRFLVVGSVASPSTPIVSVSAASSEITFNVEEGQLGRIAAGQPATIAVPAYPGEVILGKVTLVAPTVDPKSRTGQVKVVPNADQLVKLKPGMFAQVTIEAEKKANALVIPRSAILPGSPAQVFTIENGAIKKVAIETGIQARDQVEVIKGLQDGDQVVVDAIDLRDGDRVAVALPR